MPSAGDGQINLRAPAAWHRATCRSRRDQLTALAAEHIDVAGVRIALQDLLHLVAKLFMPRRISVWPTTSQTRTPEGTGIIAAPAP